MSARTLPGFDTDTHVRSTATMPLLADVLSPLPLLAAVESFQGSFIDLDHQHAVAAGEMKAARDRLAARLSAEGLETGDRVVLALGNGPGFVAALAAVVQAGGSPLLVHFKSPPAELKRTAERFGARLLLCGTEAEADLASIGLQAARFEIAAWLSCEWVRIAETAEAARLRFPDLPGVPLHPTSGSTGVPKVALRPGPAAVAEAAHYIETTGVDASDILLVVTPMSHAYAYGMGMMVPLLASATLLSTRKFSAKVVQDALANRGVTVFPAVPAMLDVLLFGGGAALLAKPRLVLSAGAPLAGRTIANFQKATGKLICPLYGTTETGGISVGMAGVTPEQGSCAGPAMNGVWARIGPAEGDGLGEGIGRVEIHSSSMMAGYLGGGAIDNSPLVDGWFQTGDLGRIDENGSIHLVGRETEVINVSGLKVVPREVEEVLAQFPGVVECKVYAGQQRSGSQIVKAAIAADATLDLPRLRAHCEQHLVYYKRPDVVVRVDALPRSAAGKILKDQLP